VSVYQEHDPGNDLEIISRLEKIDTKTYLPSNVLTKVDRATMAVSLEGREPLLDHKIIEYINTIPYKIKHKLPGEKYLLRKLLYKLVPRELVDKPKRGFGVPLRDWLSTDLNTYLNTYLNKDAVKKHGLLNPDFVEQEVKDFRAGRSTENRIWNLLIFQMWCERWLN